MVLSLQPEYDVLNMINDILKHMKYNYIVFLFVKMGIGRVIHF